MCRTSRNSGLHCVGHHEMADLHWQKATVSGQGIRGLAGGLMKSSIIKRSVVVDGRKTSVSLEEAFWSDLKEIAHAQETTLSELVAKIDQTRQQGNLSSAIRLYVLEHVRLIKSRRWLARSR